MIDRDAFFTAARADPFGGTINQQQVDGVNYLLDVWERVFEREDIRWLAYALATVFHETAQTMRPIEEYGRGQGKSYGEPVGPHNQAYYGRGHVQLTWAENYQKGEQNLAERYGHEVPMYEYPHRMLEDEPSALVLYDGMIWGWFTGAKLSDFFNGDEEDRYNARRIVNGLDKADVIANYYESFKAALT